MLSPYRVKSYLVLILLIAGCNQPQDSILQRGTGVLPDDAVATIKIADGFTVDLIAAEPLIADPVAMEVDEFGNLYVLEMHGYPLDTKGTGIVKFLTDTDDDGLPDKSLVYADDLVLPTGIMRWKKGIIVTDPPEVIYFEDTDDDGRADVRKVLLTGFARSNPQHNANTPVLGIDNWIYIAHESEVTPNVYKEEFGDVGSPVRFADGVGPELPRNAGGKSIRFKPDSRQLEMLSGESQFGQTFDRWGHLLGTSNAHHLFHEVIAARYINRNKNLRVTDPLQLISDHGDAAEVYPATIKPEHQLLTDVGVITSSCGVTWYNGGSFPDPYSNVTFIAEPVHNLVHADVISDKGASFTASRLFNDREFFASTDSWCRPVNFYVGPDGALYIIDYYRRFIEHPEWMDEETAASGALYEGTDMGRIYRIAPTGANRMSWVGKLNLGNASSEELVQQLSNKNIWWRRNAQRLLVDRADDSATNSLITYIRSDPDPVGWVHALWILHEMKSLSKKDLTDALSHSEPGVRENAVKIAEQYLDTWDLSDRLSAMASDPDPKVRYQLLCTTGLSDDVKFQHLRQQITFSDIEDYWVQVASLSTAPGHEIELLRESLRRLNNKESKDATAFFANCATVIGLSQSANDIKEVFDLSLTGDRSTGSWRASLLKGLAKAFEETSNKEFILAERTRLLACFSPSVEPDLRNSAIRLLSLSGLPEKKDSEEWTRRARSVATDSNADPIFRADALRLVALEHHEEDIEWMSQLLHPRQTEGVQEAALLAMMEIQMDGTAHYLVKNWSALSPRVRNTAVRKMLGADVSVNILLSGIESGMIGPETLEWPFKVNMMNHDRESIRAKARVLLTTGETNRQKVLETYQAALDKPGLPAAGKAIFEKNCSICHQINNTMGTVFGPDLVSIRNRDRQFILNDILLPNRSIADGYDLWSVETKNGNVYSGVLIGQSQQALNLRTAVGEEIRIDRNDIVNARSNQTSAMPEGLETSISVDEMADLLAFLKGG